MPMGNINFINSLSKIYVLILRQVRVKKSNLQSDLGLRHWKRIMSRKFMMHITQRLQKLIYLYFFTECFMKITLQSSEQI